MEPVTTDTAGASKRTGMSVSTLEKLRVYGGGPRFAKVGARGGRVVYRISDLDEWLASRIVSSTSESVAA